jgi:hypothetical protein
MVTVPAICPDTTPVAITEAMEGSDDVHVPPPELAKTVVDPAQTEATPVMGEGVGLTVAVADLKHPVGII